MSVHRAKTVGLHLKITIMIQYYTLSTTDGTNMGVIKVQDNDWPIHDQIKRSIQGHYDEQVTDIKVEHFPAAESLQISFVLEDGDTDYINGDITYLLF